MKGIVLLLLTLQGYAEGINYCGEDKRFSVTKSNGSYTLELCISRDNCMELINFISRTNEQTCDYCRGITDGSDQGKTINVHIMQVLHKHYISQTVITRLRVRLI